MATHSSVIAWRIPGMGEPGGLPSLGSHRVGHDWSDLAAAYLCLCMLSAWNACPPWLTNIPSHPCPCFKIQLNWFVIQTKRGSAHLHRKVNVPKLGFVETKYSVYCKKNGQLMLKRPKLPQAFRGGVLKARWEKQLCSWSAHGHPWLVDDDVNRVVFQELASETS